VFSCWVYLSGLDPTVSIAWEAGGEKTGYLWAEQPLKSMALEVGKWQKVSFRIALWPHVKQAEIMKVYPYNPSTTTVWFDDIRIEFLGKR
jgi:hypothetical protein